tara:strand:+ start:515 stop:685 length:171 start_codon:yes stop_codon:yes gene_type:complete
MDLNPVALDPSACKPHTPKTDLNDILKIYGDADVTVSDCNIRDEPVTDGSAFTGSF